MVWEGDSFCFVLPFGGEYVVQAFGAALGRLDEVFILPSIC